MDPSSSGLAPMPRPHRLSVSTQNSESNAPTGTAGTFYQNMAIPLEYPVTSMSISPSGRDIVLAAKRGLYIIDLENPQDESSTRFIQHLTRWEVADVQWNQHPSRSAWVASTSNQKALVWNVSLPDSDSNRSVEYILGGHERAVSDLNWSPHQAEMLATCSYDSFVHLWDLRGPVDKPAMSFPAWTAGATQVKFSRKSDVLLASSHDADLRIWDIRRGSSPVSLIRVGLSKIYGIDWSRTSDTEIATCSQDSRVQFWDVNRKTCSGVIDTGSPVWRARYTPFGHGILTMPQRKDNSLTLWSRDTLQPIHRFTGHMDVPREFVWRIKGGTSGFIGGGDIPADGDDREFQLVTWAKDQYLRLWTVDMDFMKGVGHQPSHRVSSLAKIDHQPAQLSISETVHSPEPFQSRDKTPPTSPSRRIEPSTPFEDAPKSWEEEMRAIRKKFPGVTFDGVDFVGRVCTMTIQRAKEMGGLIRVDIRYPMGYPGQIGVAPSFEVQKTAMMSMADRTRTFEALADIAEQTATTGSLSLNSCVKYLLYEDTSARATPMASPTKPTAKTQALDTVNEAKVVSVSPPPVGKTPSRDRTESRTLDVSSTTPLQPSASDGLNVPYPCLCGVRFSPSGRLVTFHSPVPHPSMTRFSHTSTTPSSVTSSGNPNSGQPQPQNYATYERFRAFLLEGGHGPLGPHATSALGAIATNLATFLRTPRPVTSEDFEDDEDVKRGFDTNKSSTAPTTPTPANLLTRLSITKTYSPVSNRPRMPSFGQTFSNGDTTPSFATAFHARHRRTGTVSSSPSDTSDIPLTRVPTEEAKRLQQGSSTTYTNHNSPHRRNTSNSGMGSVIFSDGDDMTSDMMTDSIIWSRGALVIVKDVRGILPVSEELARVYTLADDDPVTVCGQNCQAATIFNRPDIAKLWGLVGLLLARSAPYYYDLRIAKNKKRNIWLSLFQSAATAAGVPSFDHVNVHRDGGVAMEAEFDAKAMEILVSEGKWRDWRRVEWGFHPFGQRLIDSMFKFLERTGDVQTAAMLSCVLSQPFKNEKTEKDFLPNIRPVERSPSPTFSSIGMPGNAPSPPLTVMSPHFMTSIASETYPPLHLNRQWGALDARETSTSGPSTITAPFFPQAYTNKSDNNSVTSILPRSRRLSGIPTSLPTQISALLMATIRPRSVMGDSGITTSNGFIITKFGLDGEESHGERRKNGHSFLLTGNGGGGSSGIKRSYLLDASKRYTFNCIRLAYADMLYGWGLLEQRAELLKFVAHLPGSSFEKHEDIEYGLQCAFCGSELSSLPSTPPTFKPALSAFRHSSSTTSYSPSHAPHKQFNFVNPAPCPSCNRKSSAPICAYCRLPCKGLVAFCILCGHGGHAKHMKEWFSRHSRGCGGDGVEWQPQQQDDENGEVECPTGCGCQCLYEGYL
ncbi:hypothetical protein SmJEL517_g03793 [Synchytrium microbalum]|uniref:RWD domain-containing protein n=1 Tax=Synchytrium microbalum TaxID=1806994 RepID=A0A507C4Y9_9FUNG|nr:uncharacterized protein SmJEL517_g03793 [Synchytrium microbalum]TPX33184.1 hypothetical protein SmJEL517_g03793 [Synchytrium microbalum]